MLVYAIVLIVVMLATNNPTDQGRSWSSLKSMITGIKIRKKRRAFEMTTPKMVPVPSKQHRSGA